LRDLSTLVRYDVTFWLSPPQRSDAEVPASEQRQQRRWLVQMLPLFDHEAASLLSERRRR